mmetsp:Transcript_24864/g.51594  ORF Transcript_24864/g.51594 Transcript_24864/m.51594 type:complete len:435 (+) Transcript_24864:22-1326(+)
MDSLNIIYQTFRQAAKSIENRYGSNAIIISLVATNLILFGSAWVVLFSRKSSSAVAVEKNRDVNDIKAQSPSSSSRSKQSSCGSDGDAKRGIESQQKRTPQQTTSRQQVDQPQQLRNVFSVKQGPPIKAATSSKKSKQETTERPFGSSYYYAHNNPNSKGGYKDGLRAEDYVMNGPRLLSKGGVRMDVEDSLSSIASSGEKDENADSRDDNSRTSQSSHNQNHDSDMQQRQPQQQQQQSQQKPIAKLISSTPITRYLWDDDATGNVAKIHIDTLPLSSTKSMSWQDAGITKECVEARLLGGENDGLFVAIRQPSNLSENERKYHLHVPKMYKRAEAVKVIVKKHKLIVKITKSKVKKRPRNNRGDGGDEGIWGKVSGMLGSFAKKEEEEEYVSVAWPRLSAASTTKSAGDGVVDEIDEKLFKEMDWKGGDDVNF